MTRLMVFYPGTRTVRLGSIQKNDKRWELDAVLVLYGRGTADGALPAPRTDGCCIGCQAVVCSSIKDGLPSQVAPKRPKPAPVVSVLAFTREKKTRGTVTPSKAPELLASWLTANGTSHLAKLLVCCNVVYTKKLLRACSEASSRSTLSSFHPIRQCHSILSGRYKTQK